MVIETPRLILRKFVPEDFPNLYELLSDPVTMQHYPRPYDETGARRWLSWSLENYEKHGFGWWVVEDKTNGRFMGDCGITLQRINGQLLPEIGYHLHHPFWRQGYGSEAARAVRDWGFQNTDYPALYSYMTTDHKGSWRTAEKIGMKRVDEYTEDGEALYVYRITRKEWEALEKML
ncbi:MAG: GNAT family N-acetyltransferase [Clostridia bacterium]|nr:GNAT family N-acetyltransferase [Clostridia bacterium]